MKMMMIELVWPVYFVWLNYKHKKSFKNQPSERSEVCTTYSNSNINNMKQLSITPFDKNNHTASLPPVFSSPLFLFLSLTPCVCSCKPSYILIRMEQNNIFKSVETNIEGLEHQLALCDEIIKQGQQSGMQRGE